MSAPVSPRPSAPVDASPRPASSPASRDAIALAARVAELEAALAAHERERAALVHLVSHELRTPIAIQQGFLRLLEKEEHGPLNAEQLRFVAEASKACRRLDATVGDLLEARDDPGALFPVERVSADLHETIESALVALAERFASRGTEVECHFRARATQVDHDPRRIEQVVLNLLGNALRHGRPSGRVRVATRDVERCGVPGVEVVVEDDGPGIPGADRERLFAPFVRGAGAADRGGLGIGLALCRRILAAHDGTIRVEASGLGGARIVFGWPGALPECNGESRGGRHGRPE